MRPKKVFGGWVTPIIVSALVSLRVKERHKETRDGHRTQSLTILIHKTYAFMPNSHSFISIVMDLVIIHC